MSHRIALATLAVAATTLLAACGDDGASAGDGPSSTPPTTAPTTTTTTATTASPASPSAAALTTAALLTDAETVYSDGADWFRTDAFEGDGQDVFNPCTRESLKGTGAHRVVRADFELRGAKGAPSDGSFLIQVVGQYPDETAAAAAYDAITGWLATCSSRPAELTDYRAQKPRPVQIEGASAAIVDATYGPVPTSIDPSGDSAYIMEAGLVLDGDRLSVLTSVVVGQDYDFLDEDGGTPVNRMLPKAAERMKP